MTRFYLSSTATSPAVTDLVAPVSNSPTGAGNFTLHTPGKLLTTAPTFGAPTTTTLSGNIPNGAIRGMIWVTEPGVPGQGTFTTPGWELCLRVTALSGTSAACLINARVVRLDLNNEIVEIGGNGDGYAINSTGFPNHPLPITATIEIPASTFSAGSATDRMGVQVWILNQNGANPITTFSVQTDSYFSFLTNELRLQCAEGFDHIAPGTFNSSAFCSPGAPNFGPGCGTPLSSQSFIPSNSVTGGGGIGRGVGGSYTLVTGWNGQGHALQNPVNIEYNTEGAKFRDTWQLGFRFRPDSLAATQQIASIGAASGRVLSIDLTMAGTIQVYVGGSSAGAGSLKATSTNMTLVAATWYHIEFAGYLSPTVGAVQVLVNGVAVTWDLPVTAILTGSSGVGGCFWNTIHGTIDDGYVFAGRGSLTQVAYLASLTSLPVLATMLPVAQGSQQDFDNFSHSPLNSNDAGVTNGVAKSSNWTFVADAQNTGPITQVIGTGTGTEDLWVFDGVPDEAGEIIAVITNFTIGVPSDFNHISHEIRVSGVSYKIDNLPAGILDLDYDTLTPGAQHIYTTRLWPCPLRGGTWLASDLTAFEAGLVMLNSAAAFCTQARLIVMYYEALTTSEAPEDLTAECAPCTNASAARFLDSHLTYDGANTDEDVTVAVVMAPGADWTTPGLTHTLTSVDSPFVAGDNGNAILLGDLEGDYVVLNVTAFVSANELTVTNATAVPTSLQGIFTSTWARMVDEISGLDHLEAEVVYSNQDGMPGGPYTVVGGSITLIDVGGAGGAFAAVATIGLQITADLETLDFDVPSGPKSNLGGSKQINQVTIQADKSRTFKMGDPSNTEEGMKPYTLLNIDGNDDLDWALVTRKGNFVLPARADNAGRVFIRHTDPLPLTILTITPKVDLTGKVGS